MTVTTFNAAAPPCTKCCGEKRDSTGKRCKRCDGQGFINLVKITDTTPRQR